MSQPIPPNGDDEELELPDEGDETAAAFHRDRRQHGGAAQHLDDDRLARLTEEERVEAGLEPYDPDEVPPATDEPEPSGVTQSEEYQEARAEMRREEATGELPTERDRRR